MSNDEQHPKPIDLYFGAFGPALSQQLESKGVAKRELHALDKSAKAVVQLAVHGFLSESEIHRARRRIVKHIEGLLNKAQKGNAGKG